MPLVRLVTASSVAERHGEAQPCFACGFHLQPVNANEVYGCLKISFSNVHFLFLFVETFPVM